MVIETVRKIYYFLLYLRIKIKLMSKEDFENLLNDRSLNIEQKSYLLYFRYC